MATEVETKEPISESPSDGAATAIDNSSISNETAKDEALCTVAVGTLDSTKGESLVERPKETVSKPAEIVSKKHKNEGGLTSKGNTGAKGEKVVAAKELAESDSSDVNVMAMDKERATDESASQNRLQQKDQDQDDNIVHAQATKFDLVEASEAQAEHKEDEGTTDIEKLEDNGDNIKKEVENVMLSDETTNGIYNTPAAEPFEKNNSKEPLEITNEDREPADKFESPTGAVLEEPDVEKFERVDEGEHVKVEAETGICDDERTNVIDCISVAEPSEEGSTQESLEITSKEKLEPAKGEQEHDKSESFQEPEEEKLKRVNEDDIKIEAETEICADKKIVDADSMPVAEPSDTEIEQEPPEITAKEGPEPAKEEPEHGKLEASHDAIPDEPDEKDLQRVNEDMNVKAEAENGTRDDERTKEFEPEHEKLEKYLDAVTGEPEEEHERVIKYKKIKMKAETEICADERTTDADSTSVAKPSENENREEPIKITVKKAHEPAEDVPEHHECESTLDAVLEKPEASMLPDNGPESCRPNRNHENETMSKENLVMTLDECSLENDKEYEPIEKEALNLLPEYQSTFVGAAAATDNSSISRETAKDEALCTVAVGTLDSSEGEIIVEAPKETVLKYVEIVSGELKSEGDLTRNGDNTEANDEKDTAAKEHAESESSDMNVMDIDKERAIDESASQDSLHQKDQDDNIVHAQTKKFDMVQASEDKEDDGATDIEKLERINEDMNVKVEAENGICDDKRTNGIDSISAAEPSDEKNRQGPLEMTAKVNLEPEKDKPEHEELEKSLDAVTEEHEEKLERVIEDKKIKMEAEIEICDEERTADADSTPVLEPSENENRQELIEITAKEALEPAEDVPEHSEPESSLDAVLHKPETSMLPDNGPESSGLNRNHENETMSKEDLVMTLEVCSLEDEKKYEPVEKEAVNFVPEYENSMTELGTETATANGTVTASKLNEKNEEDTVDDFTVTQEIILKTMKGVEMHETTISEALIHVADDNIEQIGRETEAENLNKISETTLEDKSNKIADAEATNFISDDGANQKKELDTLCTSKVSVKENIENVIYAEKSTEQRSKKVDDNESNERCTQGTNELETEHAIHESIEDKDNIDSIFKVEQTSEKTTGVSLNTEQMGNEKVNEGSEVNQQKDPSKEVVDGVISSDKSSTEQGPNHDPKEDSGEDHLKIDTIRCEKIIITEHNAFADDIEEKNHVDKKEIFKKIDEVASVLEGTTASADNPSCKADDKDEEVRDDNNRNDGGEKLEEASNLLCENQAHETINSEGNTEVSNSNEKASEEFELVSELVPELKSQETRTETDGTQIEKSNFDENSSDKNTMVDGSGNDTEAANGEKESSREHNVVKGTTYGGSEIHEGATVGMGFRKEQKVTEKLDSNNELELGKELSVAVEEKAVDENLKSVVQNENWAEKLEGPSKVVSGKTIVDEESTFIQEGEKEDLSEKYEVCFVGKGEVVIHGQAVSRMDTEDQNSKPDGGKSENIHVGNDKPEEIPNSACEEQPRETINGSIGIEVDGKERELSQKLELVSNSVAEDKNQDIIRQKDFNVSTNDCILQNMNSEMVEKNDDKENTKEANLNKALDDCCDSHVSIEETVNNEVGQKKEEGSSSANEDQNYQATDTTDKLEVFVSEEKETQHNIFQVSLPEDSCQETGESNAMKIDYSTNDEDPKTMMSGAADLNKDTETAKEKGEENLNTAKEDCSDDHTTIAPILHTSIAPILPDQIGEHENSSKIDYGEQIYLVINDECSIEVDIHKETADPEEFEKITESIPKDHNQGDVNEPKSTDNSDNTYHLDKVIPEITAHSDDPETAKVKDEDVLEKDFSYKCDDQELAPGAADCEDNKEASVKERKENLDINMELGPEDLRQDVICETESVKVEKELNIDENEKCSAVTVRTEYTTDATSGVKLEETSVGDSYELESDDKQENTNMFEIREEEMPKEEETAGHIHEKTLGTVNTNTTEDISENQIEGEDGANNANSEIIGCKQNQATEEEIPEVANRDQHKESYDGDDSTKNGTTSEKVKVSDTAGVAKNLTETVEVQISEDASQVMKVDANKYQDYEENVECKENTNTSQMLGKSVTNENEEKTNEIHDDLVVTSTPSDEATYRNLHKNEGEKATKEVYGTGDGIPNQKANESEDGELKDKGSITISNNNVSDIPALDEETGQVENAHQKAADSSCEEQIHESISISEGANLDALNIENKNEQKSYESNGASESNENVSFKENTENDSQKEKLEDPEPEKSTHAVVEDLEITTGAEGIRESETNNESIKNNNEENFLKDGDMKLIESATELEPDHQSNKSIYPTEGASPSEETLNVKDLVDDVAKVEAHNEERHCRDDDVSVTHNLVEEITDMESLTHNQVEESTDMEGEEPHLQKQSMELEAHGKTEQNDSIVAQNEEIAERSETLKLHKDTRELIEQSSNTLFGSQEIATPIENIEKNIMPNEEAAAADLEQIPDDETDAKENSELVTDTVPNDEVKEDNHKTSKELVMDSTQNLITSVNTASQAEETKQEIGEQFSKISDYWPRAYNEEASMVNTVDAEHPKETVSVVEQPEAKQITHTSTDSTAACEIEEQGGEVYVPEDSGLDTIYKEGREELKEVSDSMPKEVDKKIGSSVELTENRENPHEESAVQEPQEDQPDVVTETEERTDKAGHEVELHNLQEEKQQTGLGELLVSQFLTKYILQEEGDALNEACDGEYEDVSNKQNGGKIPKQEDRSAPLFVVQLTEEGSTPEDKVGSEKLEDSSESVQAQEGYERNENSDITLFKEGPSLQNTLDESTSSLVVTEDGKDEVDTLSSEMSNNIARDESMEVNSTEQNSQGSTVDNEHCKPDLVQDEKIKGTVFEETLTQEEIQKDNETLGKEVDVSTFGETSEEDNLQKEKECLQDVVKAEGSYEVSDGQSTMDDSEYGENLEIKSEIEKADNGDEKQEVGNQVQILKNGSTEELTLSEPQISQQTDLVNEAKIHARETAEKFMADKNSAITLDRKQIMEGKVDENKADEEKHEKEEKEEFKPEKYSSNAAIVETKESELKPIQKCEQTRKSSESSTTEDHELEETLQLHSEVQIVESGEKKQDAVNQNQVQMKNGLNEEENLSDSAIQPLHMAEKLEEQSSVANVDEKHAVQTTETKVDGNKAGDEKDEKEEEEEEEDEHDPEESGQNSTINVEARDAELKPTPKKSHGLLSGVGSKVKHSIAKVKKAITGKSSHSKKVSAK